jgi:hypothetical protein
MARSDRSGRSWFWMCLAAISLGLALWACDGSGILPITSEPELVLSSTPPADNRTTPYDGVFVRATLSDTGMISSSEAGLLACPDIVPLQSTLLGDPAATLLTYWENDFGMALLAGQVNYIYLRAMNAGASDQQADVYLYSFPASLTLPAPKYWANNVLRTISGAQFSTMTATAGQKAVATERFAWTPPDRHYGLVARVVTAEQPAELPSGALVAADMAQWIASTPAIRVRNVFPTTLTSPVMTVDMAISNPGPAAEYCVLLECSGLPPGSEIAFACPTLGPTPMLSLHRTTVTQSDNFAAGTYTQLPADFDATLSVSFFSNGSSVNPGASIRVRQIYLDDGFADGADVGAFTIMFE